MPAGFDQRSFFLVPDACTATMLPFQLTSPAASGTPAWIPDPDAPERRREPAIAPLVKQRRCFEFTLCEEDL